MRFGVSTASAIALLSAMLALLSSSISPAYLWAAARDAPELVYAYAVFGGDFAVRDAAFAAASSRLHAMTLLLGLVGLATAVVLDLRDPRRLGRFSADVAALHAAAGVALTFSAAGIFLPAPVAWQALGSAGTFAALAVLALALDRRWLMVSSLVGAVVTVLGLQGRGLSEPVAAAAVALGAGAVFLGLSWPGLRRRLLGVLPGEAWKRRLPPAD